MIIGTRSNGKTYSVLSTMIEQYFAEGKRSAYIRRFAEEITPKNCQLLFTPMIPKIIELSGGRYNNVFYRANCFYLCYTDDEGHNQEKDPTPFCITRAVNTWQTTKGQDAGELHLICYDEFMTREGYLKDEFVCFCNLLSSLIRDRQDAVIYMLANTVNKYCPYFKEMGITEIEKLKQGEIRVYTYGDSDLKVAIEYCDPVLATKKTVSKYFAFENAQLEMIRNGSWEIKLYPRCPYPLYPEDIWKVFYIKFGEALLRGDIVYPKSQQANKNDMFIFIHRQTKDIEIDEKTPYYSADFTSSRYHVFFLKDTPTELHKLIRDLIAKKAVCFADNECGELFRNWMMEDQQIRGLY